METSHDARAVHFSAPKFHVAVIGAGAFGGWTALHLLRRGVRVTLFDAWGPGNARSSSGGETRGLRATYGPDRVYVEMAAHSLRLWHENEHRWDRRLFQRTGVIWMAAQDDWYERAALPILRDHGIAVEDLTADEAARRYPQINFEGVSRVLFEPESGYLLARRACEAVLQGFLHEGGEYHQLAVTPGPIRDGEMQPLVASDGSAIKADRYVFACGPWLAGLLPEVLGDRIKPTRQEVFFFGTPPGDFRFLPREMPVWIDNGSKVVYGIPGNEWRGFKIADDTRGVPFDPTLGERLVSPEGLRWARDYVAFRFPKLKGAPLLESRVCQYENSPDNRFIIDHHPSAENVWLVGGGSGHGFKHGPAVGERVADLVLDRAPLDPFFALSRFQGR